MLAPVKTLLSDMRNLFVWMLQSVESQASPGTLNTLHFPLRFLLSNIKGREDS